MARRLCHLLVCTPLLLPIPGGGGGRVEGRQCRRVSPNLSINWGQRDVQLYLDTFTGIPKAVLCKACSSSDHVTDSCPLSPKSTDSSGPKRGDLCFNFNKGVPCARTPCPYTHQFNKLGRLQPTQERTNLTPQALDRPSQRLAAQAIPPEAAI